MICKCFDHQAVKGLNPLPHPLAHPLMTVILATEN